jgi:hypothetical protein
MTVPHLEECSSGAKILQRTWLGLNGQRFCTRRQGVCGDGSAPASGGDVYRDAVPKGGNATEGAGRAPRFSGRVCSRGSGKSAHLSWRHGRGSDENAPPSNDDACEDALPERDGATEGCGRRPRVSGRVCSRGNDGNAPPSNGNACEDALPEGCAATEGPASGPSVSGRVRSRGNDENVPPSNCDGCKDAMLDIVLDSVDGSQWAAFLTKVPDLVEVMSPAAPGQALPGSPGARQERVRSARED